MNKSPVRRSGRSPARRVLQPEGSKREKSRSRSRGRPPKDKKSVVTRARSKTRTKSPARLPSSPDRKLERSPKVVLETIKKRSVEKDDMVRNSMSRFDDIASEAVVTLRRSTRIVYSNKEAEIEEEVTNILKENNVVLKDGRSAEREESPFFLEKDEPKREFGGLLGVLLLVPLLPAVVVLLQLACTKGNCSMKGFVIPLSWKKYVDLEASYYYIAFLLSQLILSSLPIGFHAHSTTGKYVNISYRCNGLVSGVVTLGSVLGLHRLGYVETSVVVERSLEMCVAAGVCALLLSLALHLSGDATNPGAASGSSLYDFWVGRQLSPRLGPLDVKLALIRASLVAAVVQNCVLLSVECEGKKDYSEYLTSSVVANVLQCLYSLDFLVFESSYLNSFTVQHEGTGYMLVMSLALYPFFISVLPKFLYYNAVDNSVYVLGTVTFFYFLGYLLFRVSNAQKAAFKRNSHPLQMSGVEVVTGSNGRRLLAGGVWGRLRHPNHLGVAIMWLSLSGLLGGGPLHWAPLLPPLLTLLALAHRSARDSDHCAARYGQAWRRYASKVKYRLLPGLY